MNVRLSVIMNSTCSLMHLALFRYVSASACTLLASIWQLSCSTIIILSIENMKFGHHSGG